MRAGLLVALLLPGVSSAGEQPVGSATGPCPVSTMEPCVVTLEGPGGPGASPACTSDAWSKLLRFTQPERWSDSDGDGAWETVLELRLDPRKNCGCARFKVFYGDEVSNWTVHLGNSPTNDGHGGDLGTTSNTAEIQLLGQQLTVYTTAQSSSRQVDRLLEAALPPLAGRTVELELCEQAVGFEILPAGHDPHPPKWKLETQSARLLLHGSIHAAFNRVIHVTTGAPSRARVGSGVRRVEISLTP